MFKRINWSNIALLLMGILIGFLISYGFPRYLSMKQCIGKEYLKDSYMVCRVEEVK